MQSIAFALVNEAPGVVKTGESIGHRPHSSEIPTCLGMFAPHTSGAAVKDHVLGDVPIHESPA